MFRKLSLLVIVASFVGIKADETVVAKPGVLSRMGTAISEAAQSVKGFVVTAVTPSTYSTAAKKAWNGFTWENVKAAPSASLTYMNEHKVQTLVAAAAVVAAVVEYQTHFVRDAIFGSEEEKDADKVYFEENR